MTALRAISCANYWSLNWRGQRIIKPETVRKNHTLEKRISHAGKQTSRCMLHVSISRNSFLSHSTKATVFGWLSA